MALSVPEYPNPFDPANPLENAYAYLAGLGLDISNGSGRMTLNVHPNEAAWQGVPVGQVSITLGEVLVAGDEPVTFPTLTELMEDEAFASAYATIGAILYGHALNHPAFDGATQV